MAEGAEGGLQERTCVTALDSWFPLMSCTLSGHRSFRHVRREMVSTLNSPRSTYSPREAVLVQHASGASIRGTRTEEKVICVRRVSAYPKDLDQVVELAVGARASGTDETSSAASERTNP